MIILRFQELSIKGQRVYDSERFGNVAAMYWLCTLIMLEFFLDRR